VAIPQLPLQTKYAPAVVPIRPIEEFKDLDEEEECKENEDEFANKRQRVQTLKDNIELLDDDQDDNVASVSM
jgi:cell division protein FtsB